MAYITKDLNLVSPAVGAGQGGSLYTYVNADADTLITQRGANFISDGQDKGMKVGDYVVSSESTGVGAILRVSALEAAPGRGVTVT